MNPSLADLLASQRAELSGTNALMAKSELLNRSKSPASLPPLAGSPSARPGSATSHLCQSLELVRSILQRRQRNHMQLTRGEVELVAEVARLGEVLSGGAMKIALGEQNPTAEVAPQKEPREVTPSGTPTLSAQTSPNAVPTPGKKANALAKLYRAGMASEVYKEMVVSKESIAKLCDFSVRCAGLGVAQPDDVMRALVHEVHGVTPTATLKAFVTHEDGLAEVSGNEEAIMTASVLTQDESTLVGKCAVLARAQYTPTEECLPLLAEGRLLGVLQIKAPSSAAEFDQEHVGFRSHIESLIGVAALTLQNVRSFQDLAFQREKAQAMLQMAKQLSQDNLDEEVLVAGIIQTARTLIDADRCSVFLVRHNTNTLKAFFEDGRNITMPLTAGIAGAVAGSGETINIQEAYEDPRFNPSIDKATGYRTKSILCLPVEYEGSIVAVAQLINKHKPEELRTNPDDKFTIFRKRDEDLFHTFSTFIGVCLRNCRVNTSLVHEKKKTEAVLSVVTQLSNSDIRDVNSVVHHVMEGAKHLLNADRASLFLIDKERDELYSKIADGASEIRFPNGKGIAGTVAAKHTPENIQDAYQDERFNPEFDKKFGYKTVSILAEPISCRGELLAVAQLVNKMDSRTGEVTVFTADDEETFQMFSLFAGISISNSHLLEFTIKAGQEAMALHENMVGSPRGTAGGDTPTTKPKTSADYMSVDVYERIKNTVIPDEVASTMLTRNFDIFALRKHYDNADEIAVMMLVRIIQATKLDVKFKCPEDILVRFLVACKSKYRNVPYHNFFHAVDVMQTLYTFLWEGKGSSMLSDLDCFVLLITAVCHDLDHMGVNNSFHMKTDSPLGILSSASGNPSVLEVHHCNLAIELLSCPDMNVFGGLEEEQLREAYKGMIECILATDMSRHKELQTTYEAASAAGWKQGDPGHTRIRMQMLLKAADISNVTKPFQVSKQWGMMVTEEFYRQGDKEKMKGVQVLPMFDRSANNALAKGQLGFIAFLGEPFFTVVVQGGLDGMQWCLDNILSNKESWKVEQSEEETALPADAKKE